MRKKAVVLLSGGLDSATSLAIAQQDYDCYSLSFDYGQLATTELAAAQNIAQQMQVCEHRVVTIDLSALGGSALTDSKIDIPKQQQASSDIPVTYVPARNTIFLSYALAWAEVLKAEAIFIGVNAVDYSGYPDCRPEYIEAFQNMANLATKEGVAGRGVTVLTPLIELSKSEIIRKGLSLGVNYALTISCYDANAQGQACGACDSCRLRKQGFEDANVDDPTAYFQD